MCINNYLNFDGLPFVNASIGHPDQGDCASSTIRKNLSENATNLQKMLMYCIDLLIAEQSADFFTVAIIKYM